MKKSLSKMFSVITILALMLVALPMQSAQAAGSVSLTTLGSAYTENFDTLSNTAGSTTNNLTINGWYMTESGGGARDNEQYAVDTGGSITGDTYSYGAAANPERALGGLRSGTLIPLFGANFTNNTGSTITALDIAYIGEEWRLGAAGRTDQINFEYSTNATDLVTGTWTGVASLNFVTPDTVTVGAKNGNAAPDRTPISATISGLSIAAGATFWIRWTDVDPSGSDDGLAVDDFSVTANGGPATPNLSVDDVTQAETNSGTTTFTFTVSLSAPAGAGGVTFDIATADGTAQDDNPATEDNDYIAKSLTGQTITAAGTMYTFDVSVNGDATTEPNETFFVNVTNVIGATVADGQGQGTIQNDDVTLTPIHDIQGAAHISPLNGQLVTTQGVVTAKTSNSFYMQEPVANWDSDDSTSEGILVFTGSAPSVTVGDSVRVSGTVTEFRPGGSSGTTNLTITEISNPGRTVTVLSSGNPVPPTTVIGNGGRVPPSTVIEDDATGDVETSGVFDPANDGIDFYESLEGMLVQVNNAVAVGPTNDFGEIPVVGDNGANAGPRTPRGGLIIGPNYSDFNPERIIVDDVIISLEPKVHVGTSFTSAIIGVMDYSFGNFKLLNTQPLLAAANTLAREVTQPAVAGELSVASFNVENLSPNDPQSKFDALANLIVNNLKSPDLIALEEIQDNNGVTGGTGSTVVAADQTYGKLIQAIDANGPTYEYRQIDPVDDQEGGVPGGNIRVGFLFRTDRGLSFVARPGGDSVTPTTIMSGSNGPELSFSPGRVDPLNPAWSTPEGTRRSLAAEFTFLGKTLFVIANHWKSKGGDEPLFGHFQPPDRVTEEQRNEQAQSINDFVDSILVVDPNANIVVLGDLNDFEFSQALTIVKGGVLHNLMDTLPANERYSYVFEGNSQTLDQILVSDNLFSGDIEFEYDSVHVNAEFHDQTSDHDPQVARMCMDTTAPSLTVTVSPNTLWPPNHKYRTVNATVNVSDNADPNVVLTVSVTSNEPDNAPGPEDGNTTNDIVIVNNLTFKLRAERSDTGTGRVYTITYQATDACGNSTTATATVTVPLALGN